MNFKPEEMDNFIERIESIIELNKDKTRMSGICLYLLAGLFKQNYLDRKILFHKYMPLSRLVSYHVSGGGWWWKPGLVKPRIKYLRNLVKYLRMPNGIRRKLFWVYITLFS